MIKSQKDFKKILELSPRPCVEIILTRNKEKEFLLAKRTENPYNKKYCVIGGSVFKKDRNIDESVKRELKRELGLKMRKYKIAGVRKFNNLHSALGVKYSIISIICKMKSLPNDKITLNKENSDYKWFSKIEPNFPKQVKEILKEAGFK